MRKIAATLVALGLTLGLLGAGVAATFTDSATATTSIHVGTFNIDVSTSLSGCTVVDGTSVSCTLPEILSSAAGSVNFPFTITNTGSIPANITVAASAVTAPFSDKLGPVTPYVLAPGAHTDFAGGLQWPLLDNSSLNQTYSITYTISASA